MKDVTLRIINPIEWDDTGERYFSRMPPDLSEEMHDRKGKAIHMLKNEPEKTVFDVAKVCFLPVRVVRSLQPNKIEK